MRPNYMFTASLIILLPMFLATWCRAEAPGVPIDFETASKWALENNPGIAALRSQGESFKEKSRQSLAPTTPVLTFSKNNSPSLSLSSRGESTSMSLAYTLGFPGRAILNSTNFEEQALNVRELSRDKEIDLLTSLSLTYVAYYVNQHRRDFINEEIKQAESLNRLVESRYRSGQSSLVDVLNSQASFAQLQHDRVVEDGDHENLLTQFRNIIVKDDKLYEPNVPPSVSIPEVGPSESELENLLRLNSPKILGSEHLVRSAGANLGLARMQVLPDFQLGGTVTTYNDPTAQPNPNVGRDYTLSIGINVPIFFAVQEMAGMQAAKKDHETAKYQDEASRRTAYSDLKTALSQLRALKMQIENLKKNVMPANKSAYDMSLKYYGLGKADYFRLKDARSAWLDAQRSYFSTLLEATKTYNQILQLVGCDFNNGSSSYVCKR